ncbi:MAG: DUF2070 family protein [Candidatus Verstraetearchaeota archaeon]|nr:DUF2070 family protein [Candidatus Verstraetearchaeota archaeon]
MDFTSQLVKRYKSIFSLPSQNTLTFEILVLSVLAGVASYWMAIGADGWKIGLVDGLISFAATGFACSAIISRSKLEERFLTLRRSLGFILFGILFTYVGILMGSFFSRLLADPLILERVYYLSCGVVVAYSYVVMSSVSNSPTHKILLKSVLQPFSIVIAHSAVILWIKQEFYPERILAFFLVALTSLIASKWFYTKLETVGERTSGLGSISLFKSFIGSLILEDNELLEKDLQKISVVKDVEVKTITLKNREGEAMLVAPLVHPGPFKNVGGASLPTKIAEKLGETGKVPIIFHTPTTHEQDPILSGDCERITEAILRTQNARGMSTASAATSVKVGNITATVQIFGDTPLAVISRSPIPTEDLPYEINEICLKKMREFGYSDGIVVDAHNSMEATYEPLTSEDCSNIVMALERALEGISPNGKLSAGFAQLKLEEFSRREGIGEGGIMALVTEVDGRKSAFVSIDGNNMISGLREKILAKLRVAGYEVSEVATTDTHVVTGTTGGQGYFILGKAIPEAIILEKVLQAVRLAESNRSDCLVDFSKTRVESVHLLGEEGLKVLWRTTEKTIVSAKRNLIILLGAPISVALILYLLF